MMLWEGHILSEFLKFMQGVVEVCFGLVLKTSRSKTRVGSNVF
jgi:hypothetical protein